MDQLAVTIATTKSRARHWALTINNYTELDIDVFRTTFDSQASGLVYALFGKEIGSSGTPHLQAHLSFDKPKRFLQVKNLFTSNPHLSVVRNLQDHITYCKKDGDYTEFGTPPAAERSRNDLHAFRLSVASGIRDLKVLREIHPECMARYRQFCLDVIRDLTPSVPLACHSLRDWQSQLVDLVSQPPSDRTITFVVDFKGNSGKSWFCCYLEKEKENVQVILPGKASDMAYEYNPLTKILLIDLPRGKVEHFQWSFLEHVKNGRVNSPKYESCTLRFPPPHVIVFMNEQPPMDVFSEDRYNILPIG